ncbi:TPA: hypothetical protein ACGO1T_000551 [Streptococcus suis]
MQPYLNLVQNFDSLLDYEFHFTYLGADRITTNELSIRENKRNSLPVYVQQSTRFDTSHTLPKETLTNGVSYLAKIRVQTEGSWSEWSPEMEFTCLRTPRLIFETMQDGKFVYNNDIKMAVRFYQEQGDKVDTYQFILMDQNRIPLSKFPTRRPLLTSPNILTERISDLVKGRLYYVGVRVRTKLGIDYYDTQELIPHFVAPALAGIVEAKNQTEDGQILVQAHLKQTLGIQTRAEIKGQGTHGSATFGYVYIGGEWVIIPPDKPLLYKQLGMAKASDWVGKLWLRNIPNGTFLEFETTHQNGIGMKFIKYDDYIVCQKDYLNDDGLGVQSRHISNIVPGLGTKSFYLYIKVIEFRVEMYIEVVQ